MARFNIEDADKYGSSGGGNFFVLKDDGDSANVRFLYDDIMDIEGFAVHRVEVDGKERYVNCLRNYGDPIDSCPFCREKYKLQTRLFLKLYNEDAKECQVWERGKSYYNDLRMLCSRYKPLHDEVIEITRSGKKGDKQTKYAAFPVENSPVNLDDYDVVDPLGTIILDKTADEMEYYIEEGDFPSSETSTPQTRRRGGGVEEAPARRTPQRRF